MFNVEKVTNDMIEWVRRWFDLNGPDCNAVIGISGGKDSSVTASVCCAALGKERVIGVLMPNGEQADLDVSKALVEHLGIKHYIINIHEPFEAMKAELTDKLDVPLSNQTMINIAPRMRMTTLYAVSQSNNGRVANTCNLSEESEK